MIKVQHIRKLIDQLNGTGRFNLKLEHRPERGYNYRAVNEGETLFWGKSKRDLYGQVAALKIAVTHF